MTTDREQNLIEKFMDNAIRINASTNDVDKIEGQLTNLLDQFKTSLHSFYKQEIEGKITGIRSIITGCGQQTSKYPDKKHLLAGDDTFISVSQYDDLAKSIHNHFTAVLDEVLGE